MVCVVDMDCGGRMPVERAPTIESLETWSKGEGGD